MLTVWHCQSVRSIFINAQKSFSGLGRKGWLTLALTLIAAISALWILGPLGGKDIRQRRREATEYFLQAAQLEQQGKLVASVEKLRECMQLVQGHPDAFERLVTILSMQGRNAEATEVIWNTYRHIPTQRLQRRMRLLVFLWSVDSDTRTPERLRQSISQLRQSMKVEPEFENRFALAFNYVIRGNHEDLAEAQSLLQQCLRERPENIQVRSWLFRCLLGLQKVTQAGKLLEGLPDSVENNPDILMMRAQYAMALDRPDEAMQPYRKLLKHRPMDSEAHHQLGRILGEKGQQEESEKHLRLHEDVTLYYQEAETVLDELLHLYGTSLVDSGELCYRMGFITEKMGYSKESYYWYEVSLEHRPEHTETVEALDRLQSFAE